MNNVYFKNISKLQNELETNITRNIYYKTEIDENTTQYYYM